MGGACNVTKSWTVHWGLYLTCGHALRSASIYPSEAEVYTWVCEGVPNHSPFTHVSTITLQFPVPLNVVFVCPSMHAELTSIRFVVFVFVFVLWRCWFHHRWGVESQTLTCEEE